MFGMFKKKSALEKLQIQHKKVLEEAYVLSKTDRAASDALYVKAADLEKKLSSIS
ncbi:Lacal_2735 family protein [Dokdonia sp. Hel_I_53]|uniref:Lacal_2735 family protein n=1 Tax=Dokdonia sp. Hel_I_53 TaxID=1566287 RepID=UPI00119B52C9|nr:Lacal_2735 family protein [Dokdonia sp. Hel_I_53]TVZ51135.1 hypothetical protein OD90_0271 [Dokdonia sp. Hel_I_53]